MAPDGGAKLAQSFDEAHDPALPAFAALAEELGVWLLIGSLAIKVSDTKTANRSFLIDPEGAVTARYARSISSMSICRRARNIANPTRSPAATRRCWRERRGARSGLSICYDMRFPQLYRALAKKGAFAFTAPSAFTETTGKAHWHVLLRARAIENGAFVIAPAQGGTHANGRKTYGHSLIVEPLGRDSGGRRHRARCFHGGDRSGSVGRGAGQGSQPAA